MSWDSLRLARFSLPAKLLITLFLLLIGVGYLFAMGNIVLKHQDADLEPGLSLRDLRRSFHGMEKQVTPEAEVTVHSVMLDEVAPGGGMRKYLERGGEPAVRALIAWLEDGAKQETFDQAAVSAPGDPSARQVIADRCIMCHNADGGDKEDVPYAASADAQPDYTLVIEMAKPEYQRQEKEPQTLVLAPTSWKELVHITHIHILTIPVFTLIVGPLFLMTGFGPRVKLILTPLPMLAVVLDIGSWWLARVAEPFIFVIAAAGALFGATLALQILGVFFSMWLGRTDDPSAPGP